MQEGEGRKYEDAARQQQLSAEVAIASDGRATLRRLHTGSTPPPARPAYDNMEMHRWPSNTAYRVRRLPHAKEITLDGRLDEPEWSRANVERYFTFPWKQADAPPTEFLAFCDDEHLYFTFRAEDADVVTLDKLRDKEDELFEDRWSFISAAIIRWRTTTAWKSTPAAGCLITGVLITASWI